MHVITIVKKEATIFFSLFFYDFLFYALFIYSSHIFYIPTKESLLSTASRCSCFTPLLRCHEFEEEWGEFMVGFGGRKVNENICNEIIMSK